MEIKVDHHHHSLRKLCQVLQRAQYSLLTEGDTSHYPIL